MAMHYLTVQDMLFLNLRITGSKQPFDTLNLEEAVYCQYGSGQSSDLVAQGARFLTGFAKMAPFKAGNEACAFAGLVAFLEANGKALDVKDIGAEAWVRPLFSDRAEALKLVGPAASAWQAWLFVLTGSVTLVLTNQLIASLVSKSTDQVPTR